MNIFEFAQEHGLDLVVNQRESTKLPRYTVRFKRVEVKDGSLLHSEYGDGMTINDAVDEYAQLISGQRLIFDAMSDKNRKEINAPRLYRDDD